MDKPFQSQDLPDVSDVQMAQVEQQSRFSFIWFIPLVAALVGGWLVYKVYSEKGQEIILTFDKAEGIEMKKTPVRYKDVTVGKVINVELDSSLKKVLVTVEIVPSMAQHLGEETSFWVVRPRVTVKGISGLTTLLSGIYIGMDPGKPSEAKKVYKGLEEPPQITSYSSGSQFVLQANKLGSVDVGSPIYYRQITVGEVIRYRLNDDSDTVNMTIFVYAPYDKMIKRNTRFWNVSGIDVKLSATGEMTARMESLVSLLVGGLAFETPQNEAESLPVIEGMTFPLYASHEDAQEKNQGELIYYLMHFSGSVNGLSVNSIVEYQGIKVGKVEDIQLKVDDKSGDLKIPVLVSLYVDKLSFESDKDDAKAVIKRLVTKGWRGQLSTSNFILGTKVVSLVFAKEEAAKRVTMLSNNDLGYPEIPTVEGLTDKLASSAAEIVTQVRLGIGDARKLLNSPNISKSTKKMADILNNVNNLLIEVRPQLVSSLDELSGTLKNTHAISGKLNKETAPLTKQMKQVMAKLDGALGDARKTLKTANNTLGEDSAMQYELRLLLEEVSEAANSFSVLADTIQRKPNALLLGK